MSTIVEELLIRLGIDATGLKTGLTNAVNNVKNASSDLDSATQATNLTLAKNATVASEGLNSLKAKTEDVSSAMSHTAQQFEGLVGRWQGAITSAVRMIAAPIAGAFAMGATVNSYFSGVAEVATLTGAYNAKLEEWTKKRALLARVNKEDIEIYRKGREALTRFNIVMADLSTSIMRTQLPAVRFLIDVLNKFTDWVDRNQPNIIRFMTVVSGIITALLIPSFIKLGIAMATNPLTLIIAAIGILAVIIDDLVTYIHGGESAFEGLWSVVGSGEEWLNIINFVMNDLLGMLIQLKPALIAFGASFAIIKTATTIVTALTTAWRVFTVALAANPIGLMVTAAVVALTLLYNHWDEVVEFFKKGWAWFKEHFPAIGLIIEAVTGGLSDFIKNLVDSFSFEALKRHIAELVDWLPDFLKPDSVKKWAEEVKNAVPKQPPAGSDAQLKNSTINNRNASNKNTTTNNTTVNVNTNSDDPRAVGQAVGQAVENANQRNSQNVSAAESGVR